MSDALTTRLRDFAVFVSGIGHLADSPGGFAVELNNTLAGSPYFRGTGYLPDRETAEDVAALLIPMLDQIGSDLATEDPDEYDDENLTWATIVSAELDEYDSPVSEDTYEGNAWLVAGAGLPHTLTASERERLGRAAGLLKGESK